MVRFVESGGIRVSCRFLAAAIGILLVSGRIVPAQEAAPALRGPDGFRELRWGTSIEKASEIYRDLMFEKYALSGNKEEEPVKVYSRRVEQPEIEDVSFDSIEYWFKGGKFFQVTADLRSKAGPRTLITKAEESFEKVRARLRSRFGPPVDRKEEDVVGPFPTVREAAWILDRSNVTVRYEAAWGSSEDAMVLTLQGKNGQVKNEGGRAPRIRKETGS